MILQILSLTAKKVVEYLLNVAHPDGSGKAKLFIQYGFHPDNWEDFVQSIISHTQSAKVILQFETTFGRKVVLEGMLETPSNRKLMIKSVWILYHEIPILVTLYPAKK